MTSRGMTRRERMQERVTRMAQAPRSTVEAAVQPLRKRPKQLPWPLNLYQTYVGKKWVMAITGVIGLGYVAGHMFGNLKIYLGPEELNHYAEGLRTFGYPLVPEKFLLTIARVVLALALVFHLHAAYSIWSRNRQARPMGYQSKRDYIAADWASRSMLWTGPIILLFIAFHLADLTWGVEAVNSEFVYGEVHHNLVSSLSRPPVAAIYVVANLALGIHLYHGAWSLFQSLGVNNPQINQGRRIFAALFALVIVAGNISFPLAVLMGIVE
ncbi:MAG: succinate dehydrogenase [Chloroflexi bacterium]|nr:succinate dehydrogenase [Chloroflexota bacterium]